MKQHIWSLFACFTQPFFLKSMTFLFDKVNPKHWLMHVCFLFLRFSMVMSSKVKWRPGSSRPTILWIMSIRCLRVTLRCINGMESSSGPFLVMERCLLQQICFMAGLSGAVSYWVFSPHQISFMHALVLCFQYEETFKVKHAAVVLNMIEFYFIDFFTICAITSLKDTCIFLYFPSTQ